MIGSFLIFKNKIKVSRNFSQMYDSVYSMLNKMQSGEFNFQEFQNKNTTTNASKMSKSEAAEILGVNQNAKAQEVNKAYHRLIQKVHPDKGGSDYLAKQLNKAREALIK